VNSLLVPKFQVFHLKTISQLKVTQVGFQQCGENLTFLILITLTLTLRS